MQQTVFRGALMDATGKNSFDWNKNDGNNKLDLQAIELWNRKLSTTYFVEKSEGSVQSHTFNWKLKSLTGTDKPTGAQTALNLGLQYAVRNTTIFGYVADAHQAQTASVDSESVVTRQTTYRGEVSIPTPDMKQRRSVTYLLEKEAGGSLASYPESFRADGVKVKTTTILTYGDGTKFASDATLDSDAPVMQQTVFRGALMDATGKNSFD